MEKRNLTETEMQSIKETTKWKDLVKDLQQDKQKLEEELVNLEGIKAAAKKTVQFMTENKKSEILVKILQDDDVVYIDGAKCNINSVDPKMYNEVLVQVGFKVEMKSAGQGQVMYEVKCW